jgi:Kef-type K+ transport system membrane component KefB
VQNDVALPASHLKIKKATGFVQRFGWVLFYPVFLAVVGVPAIPVLGVREAIGFALLALAWFSFGRLLVLVYLSALFPKSASHRLVQAVGSAIVDVGGTIAGFWLDHRLIWSVLGAIVVTEAVFWRGSTTSPGVTSK